MNDTYQVEVQKGGRTTFRKDRSNDSDLTEDLPGSLVSERTRSSVRTQGNTTWSESKTVRRLRSGE